MVMSCSFSSYPEAICSAVKDTERYKSSKLLSPSTSKDTAQIWETRCAETSCMQIHSVPIIVSLCDIYCSTCHIFHLFLKLNLLFRQILPRQWLMWVSSKRQSKYFFIKIKLFRKTCFIGDNHTITYNNQHPVCLWKPCVGLHVCDQYACGDVWMAEFCIFCII